MIYGILDAEGLKLTARQIAKLLTGQGVVYLDCDLLPAIRMLPIVAQLRERHGRI